MGTAKPFSPFEIRSERPPISLPRIAMPRLSASMAATGLPSDVEGIRSKSDLSRTSRMALSVTQPKRFTRSLRRASRIAAATSSRWLPSPIRESRHGKSHPASARTSQRKFFWGLKRPIAASSRGCEGGRASATFPSIEIPLRMMRGSTPYASRANPAAKLLLAEMPAAFFQIGRMNGFKTRKRPPVWSGFPPGRSPRWAVRT